MNKESRILLTVKPGQGHVLQVCVIYIQYRLNFHFRYILSVSLTIYNKPIY